VELSFTDPEFTMTGVSLPGIPFLVDRDMKLVNIPNRFLYEIAVIHGRTRSPKTWKTYGNHLYEFFSFLEENNLEWNQVDQAQIAIWRNTMLDRKLQRSTVNARIRLVSDFYQWAFRRHMIKEFPYETKDIFVAKPKGFLAHVDASGNRANANNLTLPTHKPLPQFLHKEQARIFINALSPHRNQLMAYLMLLCGLRREEVVGLNQRVLPNPSGHPSNRGLKMILDPKLTPTKGSKLRWVLVPYPLVVELWDYMHWHRPKLSKLYRKKHGQDTDLLFLSEYGEPISLEGMNNTFRKTSKKCGFKCTPHMLRHTFGTYEFLRLSENKGVDGPLHWVRDRMGHSSIATTEIYVHAADLVNHDEIDGYQAEICAMLQGESDGN
jgi:site-specific recombinase XerD